MTDLANRDGAAQDRTAEGVEHPHDSFFRQLMSKPFAAVELLREWLPVRVAARLDWSTLEAAAADYVDADLRQTHGDCLFLVRAVGAAPDSAPVHIYLLVEHQSTADPLMAFRLLRYMVRIWEGFLRDNSGAKRLPAILPVVVFQGPGTWTASTAFVELVDVPPALAEPLRACTPSFIHELVDLGRLHPEAARSLVAWTLSRGMWSARQGEDVILAFFHDLPREAANAFLDVPWREVFQSWLYYISVITDRLTWDAMAEAVAQAGLGKEIVMGLAQRTREEGSHSEAARMIDLALVNRFRMVPGSVLPRLEQISSVEQLEGLFQVALTAASAEEFFAALDAIPTA